MLLHPVRLILTARTVVCMHCLSTAAEVHLPTPLPTLSYVSLNPPSGAGTPAGGSSPNGDGSGNTAAAQYSGSATVSAHVFAPLLWLCAAMAPIWLWRYCSARTLLATVTQSIYSTEQQPNYTTVQLQGNRLVKVGRGDKQSQHDY